MRSGSVIFGAVALGLSLGAAQASPIVQGSSSGSFSNLSSCDIGQDCRIVGGTQVQWGSTSRNNSFVSPSTLTAQAVKIGPVGAPADDVILGSLVWFNSATRSDRTPDDFRVNWALQISFTQPNLSSDTEVFTLRVDNPSNPPGDTIRGFTLADLSGLSFSLNGLVVTDLRYRVVDVAGDGNTRLDPITGGFSWFNDERNTARLNITADIKVTPVPEPMSMALLGGALVGLGLVRRRHASTRAAGTAPRPTSAGRLRA